MPADEATLSGNRDEAKAALNAGSYRLVILNEFDAPEPRMIAVVRQNEGRSEWTYLSADDRLKGSEWLNWNTMSHPEHVTDIEEFGVTPVIEVRGAKYVLRVKQTGPSRATYSDGVPRRWQADLGASTTIRPAFVATARARSAILRAEGGQ